MGFTKLIGISFALLLLMGACSTAPERLQTSAPLSLPARSDGSVRYEADTENAIEAASVLTVESLRAPEAILAPSVSEFGAQPLVPEGSIVDVEVTTWQRRGRVGAVVVNVMPPGSSSPDVFVAWMVDTSEGWRLLYTESSEVVG